MAHLIAFVAPKGGIGCTTLALTMAAALRKLHGPKVALVEGDLMFGDLATMVGLAPNRSLLDILDKPKPWTANLVSKAVVHHPILDFDVVLAPAEAHLAEKITSRHYAEFLDALDKSHDFILVDVATNISDREIEIFERASAIYLLTTPDPVTLSSTRKLIKVFELLRDPIKKLAVLCNHAPGSPGGLTQQQLQDGLGVPVLAEFPQGSPEDFSYESLRLLEPIAPMGDSHKAMCRFFREVRTALWTGKNAPGVQEGRQVSAPSFNPFEAVAGQDLSSPPEDSRPGASEPAGAGTPPLDPMKVPGVRPRPPELRTPPAAGGSKAKDALRQTLSERLRISRTHKRADLPTTIVDPNAPPTTPPQDPSGKITVLIADDNDAFRTGLCRALAFEERLDVVAIASDGQQALIEAARHQPAVVLLDANMPRLSGLEAARKLREVHPQIAVLMMSVQSDDALLKAARESGVRHFLLKPFDPEEISQVCDQLFPC